MITALTHKPTIWSFDIDGVINDYPRIWLDFIYQESRIRFQTVDEAKQVLGEQYGVLKHRYRRSDYKYSVPIRQDARNVLMKLKARGDVIYISTSRPFEHYPSMRKRTMEWLLQGGVIYDALIQKSSLNLLKSGCAAHVDDEIEQVQSLATSGVQFFLYCPNGDSLVPDTLPYSITIISSLAELIC